MKRFILITVIFLQGLILFSEKAINLHISSLYPESRENREFLISTMERAAAGASRRFHQYIEVYTDKSEAGFSSDNVSVSAVMEGETQVITVQYGVHSQTMLGPFSENAYLFLSEVIFKLWAQNYPESIETNVDEPQFLEEISARLVVESISSGDPGYITASAIAVKENGNIILGTGNRCFELDGDFNVRRAIGEDQFKATGANFIMGATATPGGSVYLKPSAGREFYKVIEGAPRTLKVRAGMDIFGPMVVMPNGVVILYHSTSREIMRIDGNRRSPLDLDLGEYTYVFAMTSDKESNLWLYDATEQRFKVFTDQGTFISSLIPVGLGSDFLNPMSMVISEKGDLYVYNSGGGLFKINNLGVLQWKLNEYHSRELEKFPITPLNMAIDEKNGYIYFTDYASGRILKFYDPALAEEENNREISQLLNLNKSLQQDPYGEEPIRALSEYYLSREAWIPARYWLEELVNINPFDTEALDQLDRMEINSLMNQALVKAEETLETARSIGPETARTQYSQTISLFEKILSIDPFYDEAVQGKRNFQEAYNREAAGTTGSEKPLTIASVDIERIFPSLIHYYKDHPIAFVDVQNDLEDSVTNVQASINLGRFNDFSLESDPIGSLEPGQRARIEVKALLNNEAFNLSEDLPLSAQINVTYEQNGRVQRVSKTVATTMFRRTALTWDNTAKLASFIMPNESIVSAFSHRVLGDLENSTGIPHKMVKASRIIDALGAYGITYIEDPDSPFSQIMGKAQLVDTVRYPRTTLHIHSGDCDDSTALLASLLESSGIGTAIMTSPGHVFMAFDTEEPLANRWMFEEGDKEIIPHGGTIWIPIETTVLERGFEGAWLTASQIVQEHRSTQIEFLTVESVRKDFPPLPLAESNLQVVEPGTSQISKLNEKSIEELTEYLLTRNVRTLEQSVRASSGRAKRRSSNRLAILQARFGEYRKAERIFLDLIEDDSSYISPYMNLGNIYYLTGHYDKAVGILNQALAINPRSPMVNLALAKSYYRLGDGINTERFYEIVKEESEELSEQYAYLSISGGVTRAGLDEEPPIGWAGE